MMYVTDGWGSVYAIDVSGGKKGVIKWKFDPGTDRAWAGDVACCGVNNRGVALWKDKIISISLDGRMFSLNKATGEMVWERKVADPAIAETLTLAPLVVRDIAIVGSAGGEFGIRGWIDATDLNTGKQAWRTFTIPGAGEPGNETWKDGKERWKHGGGSVWETATYDPETDTFYQGIGNAGPDWDPEYRPGRQQVGGERARAQRDRRQDQVGLPVHPERSLRLRRNFRAPDHQRQGQRRGSQARGACRAQRLLLRARPHQRLVRRRQAIRRPAELDARPRSQDRPAAQLQSQHRRAGIRPGSHGSRAGAPSERLCPSHYGGKNWEPGAYNPELNLLYIPSIEGCNTIDTVEQKDFVDQGGPIKPRERFAGGGGRPTERLYGSLKALDPATGETKARLKLEYPNYSGALATAGNLVFLGHYDGTFSAYDAKTLQELWSFNMGTGINAPPSPIPSTASSTSPCWWDRARRSTSGRTRPNSRTRRRRRCCMCSNSSEPLPQTKRAGAISRRRFIP